MKLCLNIMLLDATPFSYFLNHFTSLMVVSLVWEIVRWGSNTFIFQAQGSVLHWGLFVERTFDAVLRIWNSWVTQSSVSLSIVCQCSVS